MYFRGTREQMYKNEGNGNKGNLGNREHRKQDFWFGGTGGEQGNKAIYFGGKREQVPPGRVSILTWWYWSTLKWSCVNVALYTELCIFYCNGSLKVFQSSSLQMKCVNFVLIVICSLKIVGNLTIFKFIIPFYSCVEKTQANLICV